MTATQGILLFAHNNKEIDYINQSYVSGRYVQKQLGVPVSLVTNSGSVNWLDKTNPDRIDFFDKIILTDGLKSSTQKKKFYDGSLAYNKSVFNNNFRAMAYDFSPYDKTLVMDTDLLIVNDSLKSIWNTDTDFMINRDHIDIARDRDNFEFTRVSDYSIDFYWATVFYFEKTRWTKIFFDLCQHIVENYEFYRFTYRISNPLLRNDYVFSIAIHMLGGFSNDVAPLKLPCEIYYTFDRDILWRVDNDKEFLFMVEKKNNLGQYTMVRTSRQNIHVMNKYSIGRNIDKLIEVLDV
jgi:hypothetical protein